MVDIKVILDHEQIPNSSNAGAVRITPGGVARNMAESFARMGKFPHLIGVVGDDVLGRYLLDATARCGVDTAGVRVEEDLSTAVFITAIDSQGQARFEALHGEILSRLSLSLLASQRAILRSAELIVVDTNLCTRALQLTARCAKECGALLYVNVASTRTALRARSVFSQVGVVTMNRAEAEILAETRITDARDAMLTAELLASKGPREVVITLGPDGIVHADSNHVCHCSAISTSAVDSTGAGDAFGSAYLFQRLNGQSTAKCLAYGLAGAALALESYDSVNPNLSLDSLEAMLRLHEARLGGEL